VNNSELGLTVANNVALYQSEVGHYPPPLDFYFVESKTWMFSEEIDHPPIGLSITLWFTVGLSWLDFSESKRFVPVQNCASTKA